MVSTFPIAGLSVPTVHRNGTAIRDLLDQNEAVGGAVGRALRALVDAAPNARDYYVQGPDALARAVAEHQSRVDRLTAVSNELLSILDGIIDQER